MAVRPIAFALMICFGLHPASGQPRQGIATLYVTDTGTYLLNGKAMKLEHLREKLRELKAKGAIAEVRVQAGPKAEFAQVSPAIEIVKEEGLSKLAFVAEPQRGPASKPQGKH